MLDAAVKAISQILLLPMRTILWRSIGLALVVITVLAIGLQRLLSWFAESGEAWAEALLGPGFHTTLDVLSDHLDRGRARRRAGRHFPDAGSHLADRQRVRRRRRRACRAQALSGGASRQCAAARRRHSRGHQDGAADHPCLSGRAALRAVRRRRLSDLLVATAWLLGREYFELAAMRFRSPAEAKAMRKDNAATVFTAGLFIAAFVSIPIYGILATPVFAMAFMVHMHKRLSGSRPELIEPARNVSAGLV